MAKFIVAFCVLYLNLLVSSNAISAFSEVLGKSEACEEQCTKSYPPHTYPNGDDQSACLRGCRLYTVTNFITSDEPHTPNTVGVDEKGKSPALILCDRSCVEAYNATSALSLACKAGCEKQDAITTELKAKQKSEQDEDSGIHLMMPIMTLQRVTSRVIGMLQIVQTSIVTYFAGDNNKVIAVEGPVKIAVRMIPRHMREGVEDEKREMIAEEEKERREEEEFERNYIEAPAESQHQSVIKEKLENIYDSGKTSLGRFSQRLGVPPYVFLVSIITTLILLTYLVFLIFYSKAKKMKGNKIEKASEFNPNIHPVKLIRPEDLTKLSLMDEEEAPALHIKIKLPEEQV